MALSRFAAQALITDYLAGRTLPPALRAWVEQAVELRLIDGVTPVLGEELRRTIDREADFMPSRAVAG